jgi:hypothetical protein
LVVVVVVLEVGAVVVVVVDDNPPVIVLARTVEDWAGLAPLVAGDRVGDKLMLVHVVFCCVL